MARPLRLQMPGALYHVMARGNARGNIFRAAADYRKFLEVVGVCCARHAFKVHAYALMPNHHHLLIETPLPELSCGIKLLHTAYARYFNDRHERVGHVFQGRFKSLLVDRESYRTELIRYIERNPVAAGLAHQPWEYPWSSCRAMLGLERPPPWLDTEQTLSLFEAGAIRGDAYRRFVAKEGGDPTLHAVGQSFLGSEQFINTMKRAAQGPLAAEREFSHRSVLLPRAAPREIDAAVQDAFDASRAPDSARAWRGFRRAAAMLLLRENAGWPVKDIAARHGVRSPAVSMAVARLLRRAEWDASLSRMLQSLQERLRGFARCEK